MNINYSIKGAYKIEKDGIIQGYTLLCVLHLETGFREVHMGCSEEEYLSVSSIFNKANVKMKFLLDAPTTNAQFH